MPVSFTRNTLIDVQHAIDWIRLFFRKDKGSYFCFRRMLGFVPGDIGVYRQALMHKSSAIEEGKGRLSSNERLEFLGDAVLDAVVADILFRRFEREREGFLTRLRAKIVQRETLNKIALKIGLDRLVKASARNATHNSYMYGNAFEALIGAIYIDRGYEACKSFMEKKVITPYIDLEELARREVDFKSKLIEWGQKNRYAVSFELIEECMDARNNPVFRTEVRVESLPGGTGAGFSKKESQQNAARDAWRRIKGDPAFKAAVKAAKQAAKQGRQAG